jgi:PAS domain S-box-containing protein
MNMVENIRGTGIDVAEHISWGTHFCQFYQTREDLMDILVPYFKAGLEGNEFCLLVTKAPLVIPELTRTLNKAVKNLPDYVKKAQIEMLVASQWYDESGNFNADQVFQGLIEKEKLALERGFDGLRFASDNFWFEETDWKDFADYEAQINNIIGKHRMIAIFYYPLYESRAHEVIDVVSNHQFAAIRRAGRWEIIVGAWQKLSEQALRESEEKSRSLMNDISDGIIVTNEKGTITFANNAAAEIFGFESPMELVGMNASEFQPPEMRNELKKMRKEAIKVGRRHILWEFPFIRKDGSIVYYQLNTSLVIEKDRIVGTRDVIRNITERKQLESVVQESEAKYWAVVEQARDAVYIVQDGVTKFCNKAAEEITGYTKDELLNMSFLELIAPESSDIVAQRYQARLAGKEPPPLYEVKLRCKDGTLKDVEASLVLIQYDGKLADMGIARDITERRKAEAKRKEMEVRAQFASRMAIIGRMVPGIANEINNTLTSAIGFSQLLIEKDIPEDIKKDLKIINNNTQRVFSIVNGLHTFARQQKPERVCVSVNDIVVNSLYMLAYGMEPSNIKVVTQLDPNLPRTMADSNQLQEVFLNIMINAETEMKSAHGKGNLLIKTETIDNTIRISFEDDGPGITKENLDRVFDPFFTTSEVGKGTGLGLTICYEIIAAHGGRIYAESKPGNGATFIVALPIATELEQIGIA